MFREEINTITMPEEERCVIRFKHLDEMMDIFSEDIHHYIDKADDAHQLLSEMQDEKVRLAKRYLELIRDKPEEEETEE